MATPEELLSRLNGLIGVITEDVLPQVIRLQHLRMALRDHSRIEPLAFMSGISLSSGTVTEHLLPPEFTIENSVAWIENPIDAAELELLEPHLRWRTVETPTGFKVLFPGGITGDYRIKMNLTWDFDRITDLQTSDVDKIILLGAYYCFFRVTSYYAQIIRGQTGSPADIAAAVDAKRENETIQQEFLVAYNRLMGDDDLHPGGPVIRSSPSNTRHRADPIRNHMPRGKTPFIGTSI